MKKILLGVVILCFAIASAFLFHQNAPKKITKILLPTPTTALLPEVAISQKALFVPYWTLSSLASNYDTYVYFGVTPTDQGTVDTTEDGYKNLLAFASLTQNKHTLLTVRMLNKDIDSKILQDTTMQEELIQESISTAQIYHFDGIVLDLEYSALAFPDVTKSITDFSTKFAKEVKDQNLSYYQMMPGDALYLARPYNVNAIANASDGIFVMSYDFHKTNGTPGPNFPLNRLPDADYDFSDMLSDFSHVVPQDKLSIIFGMFGYDWTVDGQGRPMKPGESLTTQQMTSKFLQHCPFIRCNVQRDGANEANITYLDAKNQRHIVWLEDTVSLAKKEKVVRQHGISQIGFWANGYF